MQIDGLLDAISFAALRHRDQRRKGREAAPYINHPIDVAEILARYAGVEDLEVLAAAILHDTVEDPPATPEEITERFGARVSALVMEVTDDKSLPAHTRKEHQVRDMRTASREARLIKLADHCSNIAELPERWTRARRWAYVAWSERVAAECRGLNADLDREYDERHRRAVSRLEASG
jgi:guanosine-3',5'-bis(diphosphate) 3'-pyrophosphohydrolase